jgi:hypothetical protein
MSNVKAALLGFLFVGGVLLAVWGGEGISKRSEQERARLVREAYEQGQREGRALVREPPAQPYLPCQHGVECLADGKSCRCAP